MLYIFKLVQFFFYSSHHFNNEYKLIVEHILDEFFRVELPAHGLVCFGLFSYQLQK